MRSQTGPVMGIAAVMLCFGLACADAPRDTAQLVPCAPERAGCDDPEDNDPEPVPDDPEPVPAPDPAPDPNPTPEPDDPGEPDVMPEVGVRLSLDAGHVALPFVGQGGGAPESAVVLTALGEGEGESLSIEIEGDFEVDVDMGPMSPGESRQVGLRYAGSTSMPVLAVGRAVFRSGSASAEVTLAAVVGDGDLPEVAWRSDDQGRRTVAEMPSAPYPHPDGPWDDSSVVIFLPDGFVGRGPVSAVTHLHGLRADIVQTVATQKLTEQMALSGRNAVFIAPQGPYRAGSNAFGKLDEPGGHARLVRDVIALLYRDGLIDWPEIGVQALTAHSGGYKPTASILDRGGLEIRAAHLLDALYGRDEIYRDYVLGGGHLRSSYTTFGGTVENNEALIAFLRGAAHPVSTELTDAALLGETALIYHTPFTHGGCVRGDRTVERSLRTSGLPRAPLAAPEMLFAEAQNGQMQLQWRDDGGDAPMTVRVEGSEDGLTWETLLTTTNTEAQLSAHPWVRLIAEDPVSGDSLASDRYGATGQTWLVVDGFDRLLGGSWTVPTHGFAAAVGTSLGAPFSTASNEAVAEGRVQLSDYDGVVWLLGDESRDDVTFDSAERAVIEAYLDGGGRLLISGSEVGYATDATWFSEVLHARYVRDSANTTTAEGFTFGVAYEEDYPDVLSGDDVLWRYATDGAAAVGHDNRVVVVGFPLETLSETDRGPALQELASYLGLQ